MRSALSVCPWGDPWPLQLETRHSWAPVEPPRGQALRSPRPKDTSVLIRNMHVLTRKTTIPGFLGKYYRLTGTSHLRSCVSVTFGLTAKGSDFSGPAASVPTRRLRSSRISPEFHPNYIRISPEFIRIHQNFIRISNFARISNLEHLKKRGSTTRPPHGACPTFAYLPYSTPLWNRFGAVFGCFCRLRREIPISQNRLKE